MDWLISQLRPSGGLDPELLQILRLGMFELLELGTQDWVINSHVELAKELVRPEAAPLVNGALPFPQQATPSVNRFCQTGHHVCFLSFAYKSERFALVDCDVFGRGLEEYDPHASRKCNSTA